VNGLLERCRDALREAGEADADLHVVVRRRGCARFSIGELSQHMALDEVAARARVARGSRVAEIATTDLDRSALVSALRDAAVLAEKAPEIAGWNGVAEAGDPTPAPPRFEQATDDLDDEARAALVQRALERIRSAGMLSAGMLETTTHEIAVASSRGAARSHRGTSAGFRVWALDDAAGRGASGHAARLARDVRDLDVDEATSEALAVAKRSKDRGKVEAGHWDVVMEAPAVAELLEWLGIIAFSAADFEQGKSPLSGRIGERITGERVTIIENPLDEGPLGFADPFDREGTTRRRIDLVARGVAKSVLYDRVYGARAATASTGSAVISEFGAPGGIGPIAMQLEIDVEKAPDVPSLIAPMQRGLWIRRLHYVNGYVDTRRAVMTGLSRDGCFLVEDGRVVRAVGNVRMTDSFLEMLARVDGATRERVAVAGAWTENGALVVPQAVRIPGVMMTSGSQ
jgi:predicted Zn-dependent protease